MTLPPVLATTWVVIEYLIKIAALGTVPENRRPSSSTAWLLLIFLLSILTGIGRRFESAETTAETN